MKLGTYKDYVTAMYWLEYHPNMSCIIAVATILGSMARLGLARTPFCDKCAQCSV